MDTEKLESYAELIVKVGANVQEGQDVIISAELDQPEFVEMLVEQCYLAGAAEVRVEWTHQPLKLKHVKYQTVERLGEITGWEKEKLLHRAKTLPAMIYIESADPSGLDELDQEKWGRSVQLRWPVIKPIRDSMENRYQWVIAAVPGKAWARKVFPELNETEAVERLWQAILYTSRADGDGIEAWREHNADLKRRCAYLNSLSLRRLHYKSSNGTDLTVGLIPQAQFLAGAEDTLGTSVTFNPNIPSEEVFTSPKAGAAEGIVYATKPLSYQGQLIENFSVRFTNGRVSEVKAEKGEELLKQMVSMDEGAAMLGECALIPYDSPINNSGVLFYNTLFDENASCHLALGKGYPSTVKNGDKLTVEQLDKLGVNDSIEHCDFMVGTKDLHVEGIGYDGKVVALFEDGEWVI